MDQIEKYIDQQRKSSTTNHNYKRADRNSGFKSFAPTQRLLEDPDYALGVKNATLVKHGSSLAK